jgi:hypothetical protein
MELETVNNDITSENDVLTLCSIPESININEIKEKISKYMESRIDYYRCKK